MQLTNGSSNVFITGASGFVGANLIRSLLKKHYTIHIINRSRDLPWRLKDLEQQIITHQADLTDYPSLKKAVDSAMPNYIIHLAANGAYHYQNDLKKIIQVNITGLNNLLNATEQLPYQCFVNTGSSSEYGIKNHAMKETDSCEPLSYYAATKLAATNICRVYALQNKKPLVTLRLFSVYGPYEEPGRLIPTIMKAVFKKDDINLPHGIQRRDFIAVEDVCNAYETTMRLGNRLSGEIINIGTGTELSTEQVVKKLFAVTDEKTTIRKGAYEKRSWDMLHWKADTTHAKKLLKWKASITIDKGLQSSYSWFAKNSHYYNK